MIGQTATELPVNINKLDLSSFPNRQLSPDKALQCNNDTNTWST